MTEIHQHLSRKTYSFVWSDLSQSMNIEVHLPNLRGTPYEVWGDWGPMYTLDLSTTNPIELSYNGSKRKLDQQKLFVFSPTLHDVRTKYPYYAIVEDADRNMKFHLFLKKDFSLGRVEVLRLNSSVELFSTNVSEQVSADFENQHSVSQVI